MEEETIEITKQDFDNEEKTPVTNGIGLLVSTLYAIGFYIFFW